jgi:type I restriction enzyme, S subunit
MQLLKHFHELTLHPANARQLKALILQMAVQGKLTAEWRKAHPDVEPAEKLLERVKAEKERLVKEKKMKREDPLPPINDEEIPFELPVKWKWCKLNVISSINGGFAFKSSHYVDEGVRVIRISDFDENGFKNGKIVRYFFSDDLKPFILENKNILMAMTGGTVGKSYFVESLDEIMIVNQRVATIKIHNPIFEAYINCVIPTEIVQKVICEAKNSTNDNISMSDIKNFLIPLPPLEEQKAIVSVVEQLFKEVEQLEQHTDTRVRLKEQFALSALRDLTANNTPQEWEALKPRFHTFFDETANIKKLRETILQLAVQGKLTARWRKANSHFEGGNGNPDDHDAALLLQKIKAEKARLIAQGKIKKENPLPEIAEDEKPYELPEGWVWCRWVDLLGFVSYPMKRGPFGSALRKDNFVKEGIRVFEQYNPINDDPHWLRYYITREKYDELKAFSTGAGDLLISCSGATLGRITELPQGVVPGIINQALLKLTLNSEVIRNDYFIMLFRSTYIQERILAKALGSAIPNMVGVKELKEMIIPLPSLKEQKAIVETVNRLMALCDRLEQECTQSNTQAEKWMKAAVREVLGVN